ncbi:MAG: hypothetical protein K2H14_09510, partial [Muribaculaceae bacterium]|nr:hypothetical protein [Muribaculaceae bacterium]
MKRTVRYILKALKWTAIAVIGVALLLPVLLYMPPVQDFAVGKALDMLNSKGDMNIRLGKLRLTFPLELSIDSLSMTTPGMEIAASHAGMSVGVLPLLTGKVNAGLIGVKDAVVNIGTPDSSLYMRARLDRAGVRDASVSLRSKEIGIGLLTASGGNVELTITPDTVMRPDTASAPVEWAITLKKAQLRDIDYNMSMLPTIAELDCRLPLASLTDGEISLSRNRINIGELAISEIDARYLTPTAEYLAAHPAPETAPADSA